MRYVAIKGLDRGGTNPFLSLFHCHPEFFSLSEKVQSQSGKNNIRKIPIEELFDYSMFRGLDRSLKNPNDIKNIVFKMPRETEFTNNIYKYKYYEYNYDKIIYLLRNPLRVYISQLSVNRPKEWDEWASIINQTLTNINMHRNSDKQNTRLIIYEYFIKNLSEELSKLLRWIDKDAQTIEISRKMGIKFWHCCGVCRSKLNRNSDYLECPECHQKILGHGKFNPAVPVRYERTIQEDLCAYFRDKPKLIKDIKQKFGAVLFDYWFNDVKHNYAALPEGVL